MSDRTPLLTDAQLSRRLRWLELVLAWFAALLLGPAGRPARRKRGWRGLAERLWAIWPCPHWADAELKALARHLAAIVVCRAGSRATPPAWRRGRRSSAIAPGFRRARRTSALSALIGSRLKRRLRGRGAVARLGALAAALRDIEALTEAMAKRIRRGLTRRCAIIPVSPPHAPLRACAAPAPAFADSS